MAENIERDKVLKLINSRKRNDAASNIVDYPAGWNEALDQLASDIEDMPAADVRPERHGYWKKEREEILPLKLRNLHICNICGCWYDQDAIGEIFAYCPNCGAKMDGRESERDC